MNLHISLYTICVDFYDTVYVLKQSQNNQPKLKGCATFPNHQHTVGAFLQFFCNDEYQLAGSVSSSQKMRKILAQHRYSGENIKISVTWLCFIAILHEITTK